MTDISSVVSSLSGLGGLGSAGGVSSTPNASAAASFGSMLEKAVMQTADAQRQAETMSVAAATGQDVPMHEVVQALTKAELTLQTMLTVRDKAIEAYQDVLRMPI